MRHRPVRAKVGVSDAAVRAAGLAILNEQRRQYGLQPVTWAQVPAQDVSAWLDRGRAAAQAAHRHLLAKMTSVKPEVTQEAKS